MTEKQVRKVALSLAIDILSTRPIGELIDEEYPDLTAEESENLEYKVENEIIRIVKTLEKWRGKNEL